MRAILYFGDENGPALEAASFEKLADVVEYFAGGIRRGRQMQEDAAAAERRAELREEQLNFRITELVDVPRLRAELAGAIAARDAALATIAMLRPEDDGSTQK